MRWLLKQKNNNKIMDTTDFLNIENAIITELKNIYDPEISVNIYDLGLIYEVYVDENFFAHIKMTLTSPNCPVAESLPVEVKESIEKVAGVKKVIIDLTFDPPWDKDMISDAAKLELGLL